MAEGGAWGLKKQTGPGPEDRGLSAYKESE